MRKTYIIARILKEVEEIRKQIEIMNINNGKCKHKLSELKYYDDWDNKGSAFWNEECKEKTLCYCKKCGQVFVRDKG